MENSFLVPIEKFYKEDISTAKDLSKKVLYIQKKRYTSFPPFLSLFPSLEDCDRITIRRLHALRRFGGAIVS